MNRDDLSHTLIIVIIGDLLQVSIVLSGNVHLVDDLVS